MTPPRPLGAADDLRAHLRACAPGPDASIETVRAWAKQWIAAAKAEQALRPEEPSDGQ